MNELEQMRSRLFELESAEGDRLLKMHMVTVLKEVTLATIDATKDAVDKLQANEKALTGAYSILTRCTINTAMLEKMLAPAMGLAVVSSTQKQIRTAESDFDLADVAGVNGSDHNLSGRRQKVGV